MNRDESTGHDSVFRRYRETFVALGVGAACVLLGVGVPYVAASSGEMPPRDAPAVEKDSDGEKDKEEEKEKKDDDEDDGENEESSGAPGQHPVVLVSDSEPGRLSIGVS